MADIIAVQSVEDLIARITESTPMTKGHLDSSVSCVTLYRGQSNSSWTLLPTLYRNDLFSQERTFISELRRVCPNEFTGLSRFDTLVKMQHYGLPTRLLDTTHNPLVALYFACADASTVEQDGSVFAFHRMPVFWQDNYAVNLNMSYIFDFLGPKLDFDQFVRSALRDPLVSSVWTDESSLRDTALHFLTQVPVLAVRPSLSNLRIVQQDGSFLLFGMSLKQLEVSDEPGTRGRTYLNLGPYQGREGAQQVWHQMTEYRIPAQHKLEILQTLQVLGVSKSRLFPELQHQAEFVREYVSNETAPPRSAARKPNR